MRDTKVAEDSIYCCIIHACKNNYLMVYDPKVPHEAIEELQSAIYCISDPLNLAARDLSVCRPAGNAKL